jgi:hypothetical protein
MQWWPSDFVDQGRTACAAYDIDSNRIADEKSLLLFIFVCETISSSSKTKHWMRRGRKRRACEPTNVVLCGRRNKHSIVSYSFWTDQKPSWCRCAQLWKTSRKAGTCSVDVCDWEGGGQKTPWAIHLGSLRKRFKSKWVLKVRVGRRGKDIYTRARYWEKVPCRSSIIALDA